MDSATAQENRRPPNVAIPPRRTSSLGFSRSNSKSQVSKSRSIRRDRLRRSVSVTERSGHVPTSQAESNRSTSPISPIPLDTARFSAPSSPTEFPIYLSVTEVSSEFCVSNQDWPLSVPRLSIPKPAARSTDRSDCLRLKVPPQESDDTIPTPNSPLVSDYQHFIALPRLHHVASNGEMHEPAPLLLETTYTEAITNRLNSLSKRGVRRTNSRRHKGHRRGIPPLSEVSSKVLETPVQNSNAPSSNGSLPLLEDDNGKVSQPRQRSLSHPIRPSRSVKRRKDGNSHRSPELSSLQPLSEEPTALERKKMPLVTSIAPTSNKVMKIPGPLRRYSTRRRRRMEAMQKPLPALPPEEAPHTNPPSTDTVASPSTAGSRPMSPELFENMNTSPSFPSSAFSPKSSSPWSQIFKRAKSPLKEEKSGILGMLMGKPRDKGDGEREKWRGEIRGKIRVVGAVNMSSAFED